MEMNQVVEAVRSWLDEASVTVMSFHERLTVDHFHDRAVPPLRKLRVLLSGAGLSWELVEAAADVCFPTEPATRTEARLAPLRPLWGAAQTAPVEASRHDLPSAARELLEAKDRTIAAYQEIDRARQAFQASEHGRLQALQVATVVFALLGQAQAKITDLTRQIDGLQTAAIPSTAHLVALERRLERAVAQEQDLRDALGRAERERETAQQVADHAARRIQMLENELAHLRIQANESPEMLPASDAALPDVQQNGDQVGDAALDDVDRTLKQVWTVLDREHDAIQDAAEDVGWQPTTAGPSITIVPGQIVTRRSHPDNAGEGDGLSRTTADNPYPGPAAGNAVARRTDVMSSERHRFVGAATRRIARGMDLDEIVIGLCRVTAPTFADAILVYLREPMPVGDVRPTGPVVLQLRRSEGLPQTSGPGARPLPYTSREPFEELAKDAGSPALAVGTVDLAEFSKVRPGGALAEVLRGVRPLFAKARAARAALHELLGPNGWLLPGGQRVILAPLRGRRRVIGAAVFLRGPDRSAFEEDDLLVAAQLATHTAIGVDKALLYTREARTAAELQHSMLPASLPQPIGVQLASRYLPATETQRTGGDWYDAIPLQHGRVALVVGDVMGRSMNAAAVMGQLRTTVQTLAVMDLPPQEVLRRLDEQAQRLSPDHLATCLYAVYWPTARRIAIANAGHPPPVRVHPRGLTEVLPLPSGTPIGVGRAGIEAWEMDVPAGTTLLLYTDGLVESRRQRVEDGIEQLRECAAQAAQPTHTGPPPLEALCDAVLGALGPESRDDDIALLAARFGGDG
ncbi:SpoIIE family protein phosphatase [Streptomyces celluloflavus]|uniref:PP2C family protein-serine/threonine phosphatase n=1 Tax=Streptomyces celluloflavus TaxID=58344 RepID=UPI0036DA8CD9